jgi:hypothetical protein
MRLRTIGRAALVGLPLLAAGWWGTAAASSLGVDGPRDAVSSGVAAVTSSACDVSGVRTRIATEARVDGTFRVKSVTVDGLGADCVGRQASVWATDGTASVLLGSVPVTVAGSSVNVTPAVGVDFDARTLTSTAVALS